MKGKNLVMYDTTLRDGAQTPGCVMDAKTKLVITGMLNDFGIDIIEGGFVGANKTDEEYFKSVGDAYPDANVAIFGRTADGDVKKMEQSGMKTYAVVGKSSKEQVSSVLGKNPDAYLESLGDYVSRLSQRGEVIYDAEFFFPAWVRENQDYALKTLEAAKDNGAETLVLCDTTGMMNPWAVGKVIGELSENFDVRDLGVHFHNDRGLALANTLEAVRCGVPHVQGTVNGLGERCGNTNIVEVICNLHEMGQLSWPKINAASRLSNDVSRLVGIYLPENRPYVGTDAFAHSGGMHSDGNMKVANTYQRIDPKIFGNKEKYPLSNQSGGGVIAAEAAKYGISLKKGSPIVKGVLNEIDSLGMVGDAQFLNLLHKNMNGQEPFITIWRSVSDNYTAAGFAAGRSEELRDSNAEVAVRIGSDVFFGASKGNGPVNAMDGAFKTALKNTYPEICGLKLENYKVGVIPGPESGTASQIKLDCRYRMNGDEFTSITTDWDILIASHRNIGDAYKYLIIRKHL